MGLGRIHVCRGETRRTTLEDPIRHIGKDRMAERESEGDASPPKSELEAEEELLKDWNKDEPES